MPMKTNRRDYTSFLSNPHQAREILYRVSAITNEGLADIITPGKNVFASADRLYRHPFGRDTAIIADRLLKYDKAIARQAILLMSATQGTKNNPLTEEEPGKIFHELVFRSQNPSEQAIFDELRTVLGIGSDERLISYTSIDATLEFIHLIAEYVALYGADILDTTVPGKTLTVEGTLLGAVQWLRNNIATSDIGLVGAHRTNMQGSVVADLLDGSSSFVHADGKTLVNYKNEVNTINFQSLGYQALQDAAATVRDAAAPKEERDAWLHEADMLREKTIRRFWIADTERFAMALDRDEKGKPRRLEGESILPAVALRTGIFDGHPRMIEAIFKNLYSPSMMTCVGPRTQSLRIDKKYIRYQEPPWPVLIGRVIEGAIRYREDAIARDLIERLCMGVYETGKAKEFHLVIGKNSLGIHTDTPDETTKVVALTNRPEAPQGWTVATLWWVLHTALPQLIARHSSPKGSIGSRLDLTINKNFRTISYTIDQEKAREVEAEIQTAALAAPHHHGDGKRKRGHKTGVHELLW